MYLVSVWSLAVVDDWVLWVAAQPLKDQNLQEWDHAAVSVALTRTRPGQASCHQYHYSSCQMKNKRLKSYYFCVLKALLDLMRGALDSPVDCEALRVR